MNVYTVNQAVALVHNNQLVDNVKFNVKCDDDVVISTNYRCFTMSMLFFELNLKYKIPILSRHLLETTLNGKQLSTKTIPSHLTKYTEDVIKYSGYDGSKTMDVLSRDLIALNNKIYNIMTRRAINSRVSISILDFVQVVNHPTISEIFNSVCSEKITIKAAYNATEKFLKNTKDLSRNKVINACRTGMANVNQVMQCLMVIGFPTEVNGDILPYPIKSNFVRGLRTPYEYVTEAMSAAKSLWFTDAPLKKSEYFSRRLQLVTMNVQRLHYNQDCGSTTYLRWPYIKPPEHNEDGTLTYPGDLSFMIGKYYLNETTNTLDVITGKESHLYTKHLLLRSPMACRHHDKAGVCEVCFGLLGRNFPASSNLGHTSTCVMTKQTTQSTMSNKHLNASATAVAIMLAEMAKSYFEDSKNQSSLKLKPYYKDKSLVMTLEKENVRGITDLAYIKDISKLNHSRVTAIINVFMTHVENNKTIPNILRIAQSSRRAYLSREFLVYVKQNGYTLDAKGNFVFDLSKWNYKQPIFEFTRKEQNYAQHSQEIAVLIESSMEEITTRENPDSPQQTLYELFNKVNSKLNVHLSCLEVIMYAFMIPEKGNYDLARNAPAPVLGIYNQIVANRSLSAQYIYKDLTKVAMQPSSFSKKNRPDHPVDVYFNPQEVMQHHKNIPKELQRYEYLN